MKYVLLVYGEEKVLFALTAERSAKLDVDSLAYDRVLDQQGKLIIAQALQPVRASKSLRRRKGKRLVTDGPFAETKEQLLGFVMVEARDLDEALEIADGIPLAELGTIEIRAAYDIPGS
ncbi:MULTISPECIES: YciI family protein [unclassified Mesorhizobium]|uniref:YciI family protein n=1 Tax=unclassified Mesorhizobium TaxID=325217 RepID=UPI000BAE8F52|nr:MULTISPECIES: YciI family protein [unclassified Mesorhizobium]TGT57147.1 YciI family protein [Mesorhizobium sp. M00.F.Ca.ET.170.01.1.1]AZO10671.1 YciI family protein [Mesorhizobium sp. M3A.F.Ca.ET.080.04.2.1]PBB88787.1 dehydrogenase [Mesorhizobium sp. WSM3876]RWB66416.1 MAG: YciI family protein [Mesorhizobium sp.]RWB92570.1 MAG: YciI family protein [Mesorhizobium sp.]